MYPEDRPQASIFLKEKVTDDNFSLTMMRSKTHAPFSPCEVQICDHSC